MCWAHANGRWYEVRPNVIYSKALRWWPAGVAGNAGAQIQIHPARSRGSQSSGHWQIDEGGMVTSDNEIDVLPKCRQMTSTWSSARFRMQPNRKADIRWIE